MIKKYIILLTNNLNSTQNFVDTTGHVLNLTTDSFQGVDVFVSFCSEKEKLKTGADKFSMFQLDEDFKMSKFVFLNLFSVLFY